MQSLGVRSEGKTLELSVLCKRKVSLEGRIQRANSEEKRRINQELSRLTTQITQLIESLRALVE